MKLFVMSELEEMRVFVRVAELGSFAAAAADLRRTPSAVSKLISRLEKRLGVQLLARTTRRLSLVEEGETYLSRCRDILAAVEDAETEISGASRGLSGRVKVNAGTGIGRHQFASILPEFLSTHPDVKVEIEINDRRIDVMAENVDIVLRAGALSDSTLIVRKIAEGRRIICASPSYLAKHGTPKHPNDLLNHNCIRMSTFDHLSNWPFKRRGRVEDIRIAGNVLTDSSDVMLDLAIAGEGIIRITDIQAGKSVQTGLLVPLFQDIHVTEPVPFWALTPPGRNRIPRVKAMLEFLAENFAKKPWKV